jgi:hypothetical protein
MKFSELQRRSVRTLHRKKSASTRRTNQLMLFRNTRVTDVDFNNFKNDVGKIFELKLRIFKLLCQAVHVGIIFFIRDRNSKNNTSVSCFS